MFTNYQVLSFYLHFSFSKNDKDMFFWERELEGDASMPPPPPPPPHHHHEEASTGETSTTPKIAKASKSTPAPTDSPTPTPKTAKGSKGRRTART